MAVVKRSGSTVPYYACGGVWLLYASLFPLYRVWHFLLAASVSALAFGVTWLICPDVEEEIPEEPEEEPTTGNSELDEILRGGARAMEEMRRLNTSIRDPAMHSEISRLEDVCGKILAQLRAEPSRLPQARRFLDYYLPTTLKLLRAYERMDAQGVSGENIDGTMARIKEVMGTVVDAFEKQLDTLFDTEAMDVSADITVLQNLLRREGLIDDALREMTSNREENRVDNAPGATAAVARDTI